MTGYVDILHQYQQEILPIKEKYSEILMENLKEIVAPIFENGVDLIKWTQSDRCYDDQDYYFGTHSVSFYDRNGEELSNDNWCNLVYEEIENNPDIFQQIIGSASIQMTPNSYAITTGWSEVDQVNY